MNQEIRWMHEIGTIAAIFREGSQVIFQAKLQKRERTPKSRDLKDWYCALVPRIKLFTLDQRKPGLLLQTVTFCKTDAELSQNFGSHFLQIQKEIDFLNILLSSSQKVLFSNLINHKNSLLLETREFGSLRISKLSHSPPKEMSLLAERNRWGPGRREKNIPQNVWFSLFKAASPQMRDFEHIAQLPAKQKWFPHFFSLSQMQNFRETKECSLGIKSKKG